MTRTYSLDILAFACGLTCVLLGSCCHRHHAFRRGGGRITTVRVDGSVTVVLPSNPSTGYGWHWSNRAAVRHVDTTAWSFDTDRPGVPGAGGIERWIFIGLSKGSDTVRLVYKRPWETVAPAKDTAVVIRVR